MAAVGLEPLSTSLAFGEGDRLGGWELADEVSSASDGSSSGVDTAQPAHERLPLATSLESSPTKPSPPPTPAVPLLVGDTMGVGLEPSLDVSSSLAAMGSQQHLQQPEEEELEEAAAAPADAHDEQLLVFTDSLKGAASHSLELDPQLLVHSPSTSGGGGALAGQEDEMCATPPRSPTSRAAGDPMQLDASAFGAGTPRPAARPFVPAPFQSPSTEGLSLVEMLQDPTPFKPLPLGALEFACSPSTQPLLSGELPMQLLLDHSPHQPHPALQRMPFPRLASPALTGAPTRPFAALPPLPAAPLPPVPRTLTLAAAAKAAADAAAAHPVRAPAAALPLRLAVPSYPRPPFMPAPHLSSASPAAGPLGMHAVQRAAMRAPGSVPPSSAAGGTGMIQLEHLHQWMGWHQGWAQPRSAGGTPPLPHPAPSGSSMGYSSGAATTSVAAAATAAGAQPEAEASGMDAEGQGRDSVSLGGAPAASSQGGAATAVSEPRSTAAGVQADSSGISVRTTRMAVASAASVHAAGTPGSYPAIRTGAGAAHRSSAAPKRRPAPDDDPDYVSSPKRSRARPAPSSHRQHVAGASRPGALRVRPARVLVAARFAGGYSSGEEADAAAQFGGDGEVYEERAALAPRGAASLVASPAAGSADAPTRASQRIQLRAHLPGRGGFPMDDEFVTYGLEEPPSPPRPSSSARRARGAQQALGAASAAASVAAASPAAAPLPPRSAAAGSKRSGGGSSLRARPGSSRAAELKGKPSFGELVESGFMQPGHYRFTVGMQEVHAAIEHDGSIVYAGGRYRAISKFALIVLRERNPTRQSCDGWKEVAWNGEKMDVARARYQQHARQMARAGAKATAA